MWKVILQNVVPEEMPVSCTVGIEAIECRHEVAAAMGQSGRSVALYGSKGK